MSTEIMKELVCPQCGVSQKYRMYTSINAKENPELKKKALEETIFDWRCQRCGYFAAMAYPFLYLDPEAQYAICVTPGGRGAAVEPTEQVKDFVKRRVKNLAELKEKILIFDTGLDDVAVEVVKNALCTIIKNKYNANRVHAYFSRATGNDLEFAIFVPGQPDPVYHSTRMEVYLQSQEVLRTLDFVDPPGFAVIDARLARRILEQYQAT